MSAFPFPDIKTSESMAIPSGGDDDDNEKEEEEDNRQGDAPHAMETVSTDSISDEAGTRGKVKNKSRPKCKATKTKESEVLSKLLTRADELAKIRNAPAKEMSPHEQQVETYIGYMKTQIQLIPCENWYQFTIDNMRLVQSYVVRHSASTGHHAAPNQSELYTQSSSQGYRVFPSHRYSQLSTLTPMSPLLSVSGGSEHQKPYIQSPYRSFPTGYKRQHVACQPYVWKFTDPGEVHICRNTELGWILGFIYGHYAH
ncbi:uncharacterized protein LOC117117595 [Anneissia japonica]|uniref:uncharacterized protein LOC117117595 n=1 Tax=Anneissia japonica TaxID=1529436 RepID=UPI001425B486|nr:uncharacterized protein LOC117117595 [Anneissia japonica]